MAKTKSDEVIPSERQTVFAVYKAEGDDVWAQSYGVVEIDIDKESLIKYGRVKSKTEPDMLQVALGQLRSKVCDLFGL